MNLNEMAQGLAETEKYYWENRLAKTVEARVVKVFRERSDVYVVVDRTNFYPQGGDQPGDAGKIFSANAEMHVKKCLLVRGVVFHWGKMVSGELREGDAATMEPYWPTREKNMKRHSLGHLMGLAMWQVKPEIKVLDSLMGSPAYILFEGELSDEDVRRIGEIAHDAIMEDRQVKIELVDKEELERRCKHVPEKLPPKNLRIVGFEGFEPLPCGGTHVEHLDEIGDFRIIKVEERAGAKAILFDLVEKNE